MSEQQPSPPYFAFYPRDWMDGVMAWSALERGAYMSLLCYQWTAKSVPGDDVAALERIMATGSPKLAQKVWTAISVKFTRAEDGGWRNARLERERIKIDRFFASQRANAEKGGRPKRSNSTDYPQGSPSKTHGISRGFPGAVSTDSPRAIPSLTQPDPDPDRSLLTTTTTDVEPPAADPDEPPPIDTLGVERGTNLTAKDFLVWFAGKYPEHRNGAQYMLKRGDSDRVRELLRTWQSGRLQQLAELMLMLEGVDDWMETSDRGIAVLHHRASFLDQHLASFEAQRRQA